MTQDPNGLKKRMQQILLLHMCVSRGEFVINIRDNDLKRSKIGRRRTVNNQITFFFATFIV